MFSAEEILSRLRARPFRPFRMIVSEGLPFDIKHPDLVMVGRRDLVIGTPDPSNSGVYDRLVRVAMVHVVALEDAPVTPPASANGPA